MATRMPSCWFMKLYIQLPIGHMASLPLAKSSSKFAPAGLGATCSVLIGIDKELCCSDGTFVVDQDLGVGIAADDVAAPLVECRLHGRAWPVNGPAPLLHVVRHRNLRHPDGCRSCRW